MEQKKLTGYPSIDKPWLKYYSKEAINAKLPECTIYEYLLHNNQGHPNDTALVFENKKVSFGLLFQRINETANAFAALGVKTADTVTLCVLNQPEMVYAFYALNKMGACVCVVNVLSSEKELVHYLKESNSKWIVTLDVFFDKCLSAAKQTKVQRLIWFPLYESFGCFRKTAYRLKVSRPADKEPLAMSWAAFVKEGQRTISVQAPYEKGRCALIGHTGGTTGTPKGVMLTDDSLNAVVFQYGLKWPHVRGDSFLNLIVPFAVYGLTTNLHMPLCFGMQVVLIPRVDPNKTDRLLHKYRPNYVVSIPSYWTTIMQSKRLHNMSWLKVAGGGGSKASLDFEHGIKEYLHDHNSPSCFAIGYGLSEVCSTASFQTSDCNEIGSVGIPLVKNAIAAFDSLTLEEKTYNEEGELCILSPATMLRYVDNPEETAQSLRVHQDGKTWVHTGDLGYVNKNGSVFVHGRMKRSYIIQLNGTVSKIFPERIEKVLLSNADILECCVVCVSSKENVHIPVAHVVLKHSQNNQEAIRQLLITSCNAELPEYAQPVAYYFHDKFPVTPAGKVDYRALEQLENAEDSII